MTTEGIEVRSVGNTKVRTLFLGGAPTSYMSFFPSVRPSVRLSVHPSRTMSQEPYIT